MSNRKEATYTVRVHDDGPDGLWATVDELPGCFASGFTREELEESLADSIGAYLSTPERQVSIEVTPAVEVSTRRVLVS